MEIVLAEAGRNRWRIEPRPPMRVPGVVFATGALLPQAAGDKALEQVANVAALPGIVRASYAMPDVHWGYGFPIGGVAATDVERGGVVSPGGVGFDISCGVRLLAAGVTREEVGPERIARLMDLLDRMVPRGLGRGGLWELDGPAELDDLLLGGARYAVEHGHGVPRDLERCEDGGVLAGAAPAEVSTRAVERGLQQVGSLGSANHFLEVQAVDRVHDASTAAAFGLRPGQVCVMIHCGSRGLGHQICTDHVRAMDRELHRHRIELPDRQLACTPVDSARGRAYLGAMTAAANYGRANRQLLSEAARRAFAAALGVGLELVYDVSHNLAKLETHEVDGVARTLCVHRKGATRALPPGDPELPADLRAAGQPVLVPGTMGTASYVMVGLPGNEAFRSACHGAGRVWSRHQALRTVRGEQLKHDLEAHGVAVRPASLRALAEEAPEAYKDVDAVAAVTEAAGLARQVARLVPLGVVKG
ncbi:RNA ligase [Streptomyces rubellomurinus subsp. indigoferus]|uniref:tRNA-splicing ligase RtcB n=1 Tax=Streptomyces rubellomurinus (strain ATCC 31215) TaxID=359131 RepID=A0A0F2TGP0_STRR3|nr:RtcB family protein [Streptomyces rubellomurinus]KJS52932.1 RNA ligase [Streptomyces rubellomurinus subsp. indigoferus]KJS62393.1 RNA ligase [Streptomyces rubellomurinus]